MLTTLCTFLWSLNCFSGCLVCLRAGLALVALSSRLHGRKWKMRPNAAVSSTILLFLGALSWTAVSFLLFLEAEATWLEREQQPVLLVILLIVGGFFLIVLSLQCFNAMD